MRPIWTGALSFGLVNIPIRVYSGSEEHALEFDMLHKKDLSPIRYARICKQEGKEIPYSEIVKGFEFQKGEYVVVDEADFKHANAHKTKTIEIHNFTLLNSIDSIYFDKPYFLEPDKGAAKAYGLLREALKKSKKVAVVTFVFRNKERLGVIKVSGNVLVLNQLRYDSEIRSVEKLNIPAQEKTSAKEVDIAMKLIEQLTEPFKPEKYKDLYSEELAAVIEARLEGKKTAVKTKEPKYTKSSDLMHLLKESLHKSLKDTPSPKKASTHRIPAKKPTKTKRTKG